MFALCLRTGKNHKFESGERLPRRSRQQLLRRRLFMHSKSSRDFARAYTAVLNREWLALMTHRVPEIISIYGFRQRPICVSHLVTVRLYAKHIRTVLLSTSVCPSVRPSVRPSVCPSVKRVYCDKTKAPSKKVQL